MATQATSATIDQLIISSPYEEPGEHWRYDRETRRFTREPGRRPAGYVRASEASKSFDDPGEFIELPLVNKIRPRVKAWRERPLDQRCRNPGERIKVRLGLFLGKSLCAMATLWREVVGGHTGPAIQNHLENLPVNEIETSNIEGLRRP